MDSPRLAGGGSSTPRPDAPEWLNCDYVACEVLQDVSSQIVATCRAFGAQLQGVCGQAAERLPSCANQGGKSFDCTEDFGNFITAFGLLSKALLAVGEDLESAVTQPLQKTISTLQEESTGRLKHWHQVRTRFAELQERYGRSRQRSLEARGKLESATAGRSKNVDGKAAEQHAAICELARCEEELVQSEASLRRLEDESRERLQQLEQENRAVIRGALTKGAGSLRRLLPVADKAPPPSEEGDDKAEAQEAFSSVLPPAKATGSVHAQPPTTVSLSSLESVSANGLEEIETKTPQKEDDAAKKDPSAKYLQSSQAGGGAGFSEIDEVAGFAEDSEPEDVAARAASWTPPVKMAASGSKRSLVFQSTHTNLVRKPQTEQPEKLQPDGTGSSSTSPEKAMTQAKPPPVAGAAPFTLSRLSSFQSEQADASPASAEISGSPKTSFSKFLANTKLSEVGSMSNSTRTADGSCTSSNTAEATPHDRLGAAGAALAGQPASTELWKEVQIAAHAPQSSKHDSRQEEDSDEDEELSRRRPQVVPLEEPEIPLEFSPVIAEEPQQCFERYVQRVPERFLGTTECNWDKLQGRAAEHLLGAHVGKLEFFWVCQPGTQGSAESAVGLVCFQFVQGCASNFVRVLHLSVTETASATWQDILPSAVLEVRRLLFGTLPVDTMRAIVLANEDDGGKIFVDRDVEVAYQRCYFKWFQLTQNVCRTKKSKLGLQRRGKKLASRFLVLQTYRDESDPKAPQSSIGRMAELKLRDDAESTAAGAAVQAAAGDAFASF